VKKFPATG